MLIPKTRNTNSRATAAEKQSTMGATGAASRDGSGYKGHGSWEFELASGGDVLS